MPVYLVHGFRWPRPLIRIHIILKSLDDAAAEWLVAPGTTHTMLDNFNELFPDTMKHLPQLRFVEQYDPNDISPSSVSQPYAYVADICEEVKLGLDVDEFRGKGVPSDQWAAVTDLRDKIAPEEKVGWYVVVCGDEERWAPPTMSLLREGGQNGIGRRASGTTDSTLTQQSTRPSVEQKPSPSPKEEESRGFKKLFSSGRFRRKSRSAVDGPIPPIFQEQPPPLPQSRPQTGVSSTAPQLPDSKASHTDSFAALTSGNSPNITSNSATPSHVLPPPTRLSPAHGSLAGSVSPIREDHSFTPNTDFSISPLRRDSYTPPTTSNERGVSPNAVRRALGPIDRIRNMSPVANRNSYSHSSPNPTPLQQQSQTSVESQKSEPIDRQPNKRLLLNTETDPLGVAHPAEGTPQLSYGGRRAQQQRLPSYEPSKTRTSTKDDDLEVIKMRPITSHHLPAGSSPALYTTTHSDSNGYSIGHSNGIHPDQLKHQTEDSEGEPYFGSTLTQFDLIANNIENAFISMR